MTPLCCASWPAEHVDLDVLSDWIVAAAPVARRVSGIYEARRRARTRYSAWRSQYEGVFYGMVGEVAVSAYTGLPWNAGDPFLADVGDDIEVRRTKWRSGHLPVRRKDDKLERRFVLVTPADEAGVLRLQGWAYGHEARDKGFEQDGPVAEWWLAQDELHRMPLHV